MKQKPCLELQISMNNEKLTLNVRRMFSENFRRTSSFPRPNKSG